MNIRDEEDKLFEEWKVDYNNRPKDNHPCFVEDGCLDPETYQNESRKIVFVLKNPNLGGSPPSLYQLRDDLMKVDHNNNLHRWWAPIARWCYFLQYPAHHYKQATTNIREEDAASVIKYLKHYCFIQLKKDGFGSSTSNKELEEAIKNDGEKIKRQLNIYTPDVIIACGTGDQLSSELFHCQENCCDQTSSGIKYWKIVELNHKPCYLIDYCHPSVRCGTKVRGLIEKGLATAVAEIENIEEVQIS
jgi:hypothetical protein